jgi:hypothetical protein
VRRATLDAMSSRPVLVAALGAAVLAGCTREAPRPAPSPAPPPVPPDLAPLDAAIAEEQALLGLYDQLVLTPSGRRLGPLRAHHAAHLADLELARARLVGPRPSPGTPSPTGAGTPNEPAPSASTPTVAPSTPGGPPVPGATIPSAVAAERRSARSAQTAVSSVDAALALLLAEVAASHAQHVVALGPRR